MAFDDEDPVIASYDVYISSPPSSTSSKAAPKLYVLQYPSHRPNVKPYNSSRSQKPTSFRQRPNTGIIEVDVPILTSDNYNKPLGEQYGKAMHESKINHPMTSHGLSGGFSQNQTSNIPLNLSDVPQHGFTDTNLHTQTLGGKIATSTDEDPIYMLATLKRQTKELHLRHLDAVVQLRPQLHHIDAAEEMKKRVESAATRAKVAVDPSAPTKLETKAIEMKLRDSNKEEPRDRNLNRNPQLLRDIQNDPWKKYNWIEGPSQTPAPAPAQNSSIFNNSEPNRQQLKSTLDNDEWLNKMSSPGIELRTRLKGRDRERARRKRQERARANRAEAATNAAASGTQVIHADISATESSADEEEDETARTTNADTHTNTAPTSATEDATMTEDATTGPPETTISSSVEPANPNETNDTLNIKVTNDTSQPAVRPSTPEIQIKQEVAPPMSMSEPAADPNVIPAQTTTQISPQASASSSASAPVPAPAPAPKRRGRPPKAKS